MSTPGAREKAEEIAAAAVERCSHRTGWPAWRANRACITCIESALREAKVAGEGWRGIESAPKDGTQLIAMLSEARAENGTQLIAMLSEARAENATLREKCSALEQRDKDKRYWLESENATLRAALELLMGGHGWQRHYECSHGTPMGEACQWATCPHDVVRAALAPKEGKP